MRAHHVLGLTLLLAFGFAQSQGGPRPVSPVPAQARNTSESNQGAAGKQEITVNFPSALNLNVTGSANIKAESKQTGADAEPHKWTDPANIIAFLLFLATLILALATWCLVRGTEKTAKRQLRAYVALDDVYFPWVPSQKDPSDRTTIVEGSHAKVKIKNFGQTPAKNITLRLSGTYAPGSGEFERRYGGRNYIGPRLNLSPTQSYATRVSPERFTFDPNIPKDAAGNEPFIFGAIAYEDIFGRWWLSEFCYHYDTDPNSKNRFIPHWHGNKEQGCKTEKEALDSLIYTLPPEPYMGRGLAAS